MNQARSDLAALDIRLNEILSAVRSSQVWDATTSSSTPPTLLKAIVREIMWSVCQYQRHTTEAGFAMLGRLPETEPKLLRSLVRHKAEEAEHVEWARRDYLLLGGSESRLAQPASPATFAVSAVWDRMAAHEDAFGYLGAEYLFEALTMQVAPEVMSILRARGIPAGQVGFIAEHAVEDVKHTKLIVHWILDIASRYPGSGAAMLRCFDYFALVYPLPVWDEALIRARESIPVRP